ncbi:hypothetical protein F5Y04DRAFT_263869 [Hypomontagnella monticulosa]|nr:hypothetical protein F5Y04DRAFT_263869 [Hypomontagnella monticulosa]
MNRLCYSSYGNLEAVINFTGHNESSKRSLVHLYQEHTTGKWHKCDVVSYKPFSGGSIIQNSTKRQQDQVHGDFEVLVLEENGLVQQYTRDNTIPVDSGEYAWKLSATVNGERHQQYGDIVACDAAPIYQSNIPIDGSEFYDASTLETTILTSSGTVLHYRCPQTNGDWEAVCHRWELTGGIAFNATGPACLYQRCGNELNALVPMPGCIAEYSFKGGVWNVTNIIKEASGPASIFNLSPEEPSLIFAIVRCQDGFQPRSSTGKSPSWMADPITLPLALRIPREDPRYKECKGNPMALVSRFPDPKNCWHMDAIVFHPCGTEKQDRWMVLHWNFDGDEDGWVVSGVVLDDIEKAPL